MVRHARDHGELPAKTQDPRFATREMRIANVTHLYALLATLSTPTSAPVIAAARLRKGSVNSARGARRIVAAVVDKRFAERPDLLERHDGGVGKRWRRPSCRAWSSRTRMASVPPSLP